MPDDISNYISDTSLLGFHANNTLRVICTYSQQTDLSSSTSWMHLPSAAAFQVGVTFILGILTFDISRQNTKLSKAQGEIAKTTAKISKDNLLREERIEQYKNISEAEKRISEWVSAISEITGPFFSYYTYVNNFIRTMLSNPNIKYEPNIDIMNACEEKRFSALYHLDHSTNEEMMSLYKSLSEISAELLTLNDTPPEFEDAETKYTEALQQASQDAAAAYKRFRDIIYENEIRPRKEAHARNMLAVNKVAE